MPPRLNPAAFDAFLAGDAGIGQSFVWRPASICPCVSQYSGGANPQCPRCAGKGRTWAAGIAARAGMTGQKIDKVWAQLGRYEDGDATLTVPQSSPLYEAGEFDRVTMLNSTDRFDLAMVHGQPDERFLFRCESIDRVFWYTGPNDGTGDLVEGGIPTADDTTGALTWSAGEPPAGKQYAITGTRYPEYFVWRGMPSDRAAHYGARLPKKLLVRRFDLFGR